MVVNVGLWGFGVIGVWGSVEAWLALCVAVLALVEACGTGLADEIVEV